MEKLQASWAMNRGRTLRLASLFILFDTLLFTVGCSAAWTTEASSIIALVVPAIQSALLILSAFGLGLSPEVMTQVNNWAAQSETALAQVKTLIEQYSAAEAVAQPGILTEIQTLLATVSSNLNALLPTLHVTNQNTQTKIVAVFEAVSAEIAALLNLVPAIQGKVTAHEELKALMTALKSPREFREDFNRKAGEFGKEYEIAA